MTRSILITGCSSGIGLDAARALKSRGWHVVVACRAEADVTTRAAEGFDAVRIDHREPASVEAGWTRTKEITGGRLDALFNNGGHGMSGAAEDVPRAALEEVFASNLFGVHQLTRLALPGMIAQGAGRIVQHSSVVGYAPLRWRAAYVASKHALEGLTKTMRVELRGTGVHVSLLNTGPVTSRFRKNSTLQFERWIDVDASRHAQFYRTDFAAERNSDAPSPFELPASAVVKRLIHAIESPRPRRRYHITVPAHIGAILNRTLPDAAQDWLMSKI